MGTKVLKPEQRLIVAADFKQNYLTVTKEGPIEWVRGEVLKLADSLQGTGVILKVNDALRACGYGLIREIHDRGLSVFADLKLNDIPDTLERDGDLLRDMAPELLTVMCSSGTPSLVALKKVLPNVEILGVTVLTSLKEDESAKIHGITPIASAARILAEIASNAGMDGLIMAPSEIEWIKLRIRPEMTINTPAIRPTWAIVKGDDQNPDRIMTPAKAIAAGATRIVVGRPIVTASCGPREATLRTLEEVAHATSALAA